jgi:hypothetical protein
MSLELAAQHLASRGRKGDTSLVHMAPQEVAGLQALAKAHGGSLTLNPDTGLPEANFLRNLLPTLIGAGLSVASGGTLTPLMAAGITGAGYGVATGSLQKGLMAGLGAYGGAGLAGGLTAAAGTVGAGAGAAGASEMAATQAGLQQNALTSAGLPSSAAAGTGSMSFAPGMTTNVLGTTPLAGPMSVPVSAGQLAAGVPQVATATPMPAASSVADRFAQAGKGFGALGTETGRSAFMGNAASKGVAASGVGGGMGLMKSAYAAATPMMMPEPAKQGPKDDEKPHEYDYDPGRVSDPGAVYTGAPTGERRYFDHRFTRRAADGGLMGLGAVQSMSDRNMAEMMAANGGQGFADGGPLLDPDYYRNQQLEDRYLPAQTERTERSGYAFGNNFSTMPPLLTPAPVTAMPNNSAVRPVEENPFYTMSGQSGDAFKYLMGQAPASRGVAAPTVPGGGSGSGGFLGGTLGGVTGFASPEGIVDATTGRVTPWSASNPKPTGGGFFGNSAALPAGDTIEYDYKFDPVTNQYSRTVKPTDSAAAAAATTRYTPVDFGGGDTGDTGGGMASNNAPVSNMGTDDGFGGDGANAGAPGGGNAAGGAGNSGDGGTGDSSTATDGGGPSVGDASDPGGSVGGGGGDSSSGASDGSGPGAGAGTGGASAGDSGDGGTGAASSAGDGGGGGGGDGCFLTTAAVKHMGQKDDGEVLSTLRKFRDSYMRKNKEKSKDVAWYYDNAPRIVAALDRAPNGAKLYKKMYKDYIHPAYEAIKSGERDYAYELYKDGIDFAKKASGIDKDELAPRYGKRGYADGGIAAFAAGGASVAGGGRSLHPAVYGQMNQGGISALAMAQGGPSHLGDYSDGGRLLKGPGDGVSDSIPATIADKRPARLADGEFVVPARIVSELGNGSTEAGARQLYAMMDRIQKARKKSIGKNRVAVNSRAAKLLPA